MKIAVCIKQVPDPETPASQFKVDSAARKVVPAPGISPVVDPYAENAVEAALQIKDADPDAQVVAFAVGPESARDQLKHALAMGCDEAVLITDPALAAPDSWQVARSLAAAITARGPFDYVFCGRQAADDDMGVVPAGLAEILGLPSTTIALKIEQAGEGLRVQRLVEDGYHVVELPRPCLVSISNEVGEARYPTMKGIMASGKKPMAILSLADLGLEPDQVAPRVTLTELFVPEKVSQVEFIGGDSPQEQGANLALRLRQEKLI